MRARDDPNEFIPYGRGHAGAMLRLGLKELRAAAVFQESNIVQTHEYGIFGSETPGEIADSRRSEELDLNEEPSARSILDERLKQAETSRDGRGREPREPELERE